MLRIMNLDRGQGTKPSYNFAYAYKLVCFLFFTLHLLERLVKILQRMPEFTALKKFVGRNDLKSTQNTYEALDQD